MVQARRPNKMALKLHDLGRITSMEVRVRQVGVDEQETMVTLNGNGSVTAKWDTVRDYIDVYVAFDGIARLTDVYQCDVAAWLRFVESEQKDYKEFQRLQKKFQHFKPQEA